MIEDALSRAILVAHAGSLISLLHDDLAPGFTANTGYAVTRRPGPAVGLANLILTNALAPDVYMSADAETNRLLMGSAGENKVRWFFGCARSRMVLAYSPRSRFKAELDAAATGQKPWHEVLQLPDLVLKRSDPHSDPGGYRSIFVLQLAEQYYQLPGLKERILQGDENEAQLLRAAPNLLDGSVDAMLLYVTSALEYGLPYIQLPDEIDLSNPAMTDRYRSAHYTNPHGQRFYGTPATYSVTIPVAAANPAGAVDFVAYLFSAAGRSALHRHGFAATGALLGGDVDAVPTPLRSLIAAHYP
ncbi:MAG TPA: extracellular solute-binding protein [Caldilineaceae bacterium]|nr:extracellular solute-binding protein [Caldilineaceae bacterium]